MGPLPNIGWPQKSIMKKIGLGFVAIFAFWTKKPYEIIYAPVYNKIREFINYSPTIGSNTEFLLETALYPLIGFSSLNYDRDIQEAKELGRKEGVNAGVAEGFKGTLKARTKHGVLARQFAADYNKLATKFLESSSQITDLSKNFQSVSITLAQTQNDLKDTLALLQTAHQNTKNEEKSHQITLDLLQESTLTINTQKSKIATLQGDLEKCENNLNQKTKAVETKDNTIASLITQLTQDKTKNTLQENTQTKPETKPLIIEGMTIPEEHKPVFMSMIESLNKNQSIEANRFTAGLNYAGPLGIGTFSETGILRLSNNSLINCAETSCVPTTILQQINATRAGTQGAFKEVIGESSTSYATIAFIAVVLSALGGIVWYIQSAFQLITSAWDIVWYIQSAFQTLTGTRDVELEDEDVEDLALQNAVELSNDEVNNELPVSEEEAAIEAEEVSPLLSETKANELHQKSTIIAASAA